MIRRACWSGIALLLVSANAGAAPRIEKYRSRELRALVTVTVPEGGPKGTIVVAGGTDGRWGKFAAAHRLALVDMALKTTKIDPQRSKDYTDVEARNPDELLADAMKAMGLEHIK